MSKSPAQKWGTEETPKFDLNLDLVDWLHEPGLCRDAARVQHPPGGGYDLPATPVDGVSVQGNIVDVEADAPHVFVAENSLKSQERS